MLESMKKNKAGILLMCVSSVCACVGQLFWKLSAKEGILLLLFGFLFYGAGAFIMLIAYRFGSLSVLQPVLSLNYVFSVISVSYTHLQSVQHAGIILGLGAHRVAGHSHYGISKGNYGHMGRLCYAQDMSAVTAACMMIKKTVFMELNGFDERFKIALNDVDLCMRIRKKGLLIVFTPFAEAYHYESKSRGLENTPEKEQRFLEESALFKGLWQEELAAGDPYYSPNFSLDRSDFYLKEKYYKRTETKKTGKES